MDMENNSNPNMILQDVYFKHISLIEVEKRRKAQFFEFIESRIVPLMKMKDILFKTMFQEVYHGGSYINGKRANNAYEYDMVLVFKLPIEDVSCMEFSDNRCDPGFVTCNLKNDIQNFVSNKDPSKNILQNLKEKILLKGADGLILSPGGTRAWIDSLLRKSLNDADLTTAYRELGIKNIQLKTSGTALTLEATYIIGYQVTVDIVPAYVFKCQEIFHLKIAGKDLKAYWTSNRPYQYPEFTELTRYDDCFIYDTVYRKRPKNVLSASHWRLDFVDMEKRLIYQHGCAKMVIELLEYFRDCNQEIQGLPSYALKTVVMLVIREYPSYSWNEANLSICFLFALKKLQERLNNRFIPFYFHPKSNILHIIAPADIFKMDCWLRKVLNKLNVTNDMAKSKGCWYAYFKQPSTLDLKNNNNFKHGAY